MAQAQRQRSVRFRRLRPPYGSEQLFEQIVRRCVEVGLVQGKHLSVDAAKESRIPREQLVEAAQVHHSVRQYLRKVEQQNPVEEPVCEQDKVSTTDPDSTYATKGGTPARLGYYDNYLVDNHSCVIVGVQATAARMSQETVARKTCSPVSRDCKDENRRSRAVQYQPDSNRYRTAAIPETVHGGFSCLQQLSLAVGIAA